MTYSEQETGLFIARSPLNRSKAISKETLKHLSAIGYCSSVHSKKYLETTH